ncbi:MAG: orotate phosphoribosyltransferase [Armatimonadetes bacterium]|nr:orotate phosphoribosyltransferase [Armatimonadota bacterium]
MPPEGVLDAFREADALLEGHFLLASGRHSDRYLEKALVLQYPRNVERMCRELARRFEDSRPDVVIGPTTLGVVLSYEVAKHLGARSIFAEREGDGRALRRGFRIEPGQRVLVVDDILTTGGSVRDVLEVVREWQGETVGVGVLVDRSTAPLDFGVRTEALLKMEVTTYAPEECPLCRDQVPLVKPGTTPKPSSSPLDAETAAPAL